MSLIYKKPKVFSKKRIYGQYVYVGINQHGQMYCGPSWSEAIRWATCPHRHVMRYGELHKCAEAQ